MIQLHNNITQGKIIKNNNWTLRLRISMEMIFKKMTHKMKLRMNKTLRRCWNKTILRQGRWRRSLCCRGILNTWINACLLHRMISSKENIKRTWKRLVLKSKRTSFKECKRINEGEKSIIIVALMPWRKLNPKAISVIIRMS